MAARLIRIPVDTACRHMNCPPAKTYVKSRISGPCSAQEFTMNHSIQQITTAAIASLALCTGAALAQALPSAGGTLVTPSTPQPVNPQGGASGATNGNPSSTLPGSQSGTGTTLGNMGTGSSGTTGTSGQPGTTGTGCTPDRSALNTQGNVGSQSSTRVGSSRPARTNTDTPLTGRAPGADCN